MGENAITDEELLELQQKGVGRNLDPSQLNAPKQSAKLDGAIPEWSQMPPSLKVPRGKVVAFMRFEKDKTDASWLGDRNIVLWSLTIRDERHARQRTFGEPSRIYEEMAKGMIRAIDGKDMTGEIGLVEAFWDEIGPKNRQMLMAWYHSQHGMTDEARLYFFANCVATRTAS